MTTNDDQLLINQIFEGDTHAFSILVDRYKNLVYTVAIRMLKHKEEAEEVAQDTFVKCTNHYIGLKVIQSFRHGYTELLTTLVLDRIKKNKKHFNEVEINEFTAHQVKTLDNALENMQHKEQAEAIQRCIEQLLSEDSMMLTLYYFEDLSLKELSEIMGISANSVKVKLFRCRKKLASILKSQLEPEIIEYYERERR